MSDATKATVESAIKAHVNSAHYEERGIHVVETAGLPQGYDPPSALVQPLIAGEPLSVALLARFRAGFEAGFDAGFEDGYAAASSGNAVLDAPRKDRANPDFGRQRIDPRTGCDENSCNGKWCSMTACQCRCHFAVSGEPE